LWHGGPGCDLKWRGMKENTRDGGFGELLLEIPLELPASGRARSFSHERGAKPNVIAAHTGTPRFCTMSLPYTDLMWQPVQQQLLSCARVSALGQLTNYVGCSSGHCSSSSTGKTALAGWPQARRRRESADPYIRPGQTADSESEDLVSLRFGPGRTGRSRRT
jgi:hypothetical protein